MAYSKCGELLLDHPVVHGFHEFIQIHGLGDIFIAAGIERALAVAGQGVGPAAALLGIDA